MNKEEFEKELLKLGIVLTEKQKSQLEEFYNILIEENHHLSVILYVRLLQILHTKIIATMLLLSHISCNYYFFHYEKMMN